MKTILMIAMSMALLPALAEAATLSTIADARYRVGDVTQGELIADERSTHTGGLTQSLEANASTASGRSRAKADVDYATRQFSLFSLAKNGGGNAKALHWGRARTELTATYRVEGSGALFLELFTTGFASSLTDRDDGRALTHVLAGLRVETPGNTVTERVSTADPAGPVFDLNGHGFEARVEASVEIEHGDMLTLNLFGLADAGDFPSLNIPRTPLGSFFEATAEVSGTLSLRKEGIRLVPISEEISPVPLPAGLPLLLVGVGSLALARRRQTLT